MSEVTDMELAKATGDKVAKAAEVDFESMKLTEEEVLLIEALTPAQQRYAQLAVNTNMTINEIAKSLKQPKARVERWAKDPHIKLYIKKLQIDSHKSHRAQSTQQLITLRDRLYGELERRFEDFDHNHLPKDQPEWYQKKLAETKVAMAPLKDVLKAFEIVDKQIDNKDLIQTTQDEFVERVVAAHHEKKLQQRRLARAMERKGYTSYIELVENADGTFDLPEESAQSGESEDSENKD